MQYKTTIRITAFFFLFIIPLLCFADYKVVIKKNGKIIEGKLVAEDEKTVTIINQGIRLSYKKETLDLGKMKELNADYYGPGDVRTVDRPAVSDQPAKEVVPLGDVARQSREAKKTEPVAASDANERALAAFIADLEEKVRVQSSEQLQMKLSKAKKALNYCRERDSSQLSTTDRRLMLEQLVDALDFQYRKELEAGAPDEKTAALKKKIEATQQELSKLQ